MLILTKSEQNKRKKCISHQVNVADSKINSKFIQNKGNVQFFFETENLNKKTKFLKISRNALF